MKQMNTFIINEESRQHINLSNHAMNIIESDMIRFNNDCELKNRSGFMNIIIKNYFDDFPLSRKIALKQIQAIQKASENVDRKVKSKTEFNKELTNLIVNEFSKEIMKKLIQEYTNKYSNESQFKLKLNKENVELLLSVEDAKFFNYYAPRKAGVSFLIKVLLESYSLLTREQRERIFFKQTLEIVESAIKNRHIIRFKDEGNIRKAIPLSVHKPKVKESIELVIVEKGEDNVGMLDNITIKHLASCNLREEKSETFKKSDSEHFERMIKYFFEDRETKSNRLDEIFTVEFTEFGLRRFIYEEDRLPIIGIQDASNEKIYTFKTNETLMFMNLFKFGSQAQIISPVEARDRFKKLYKASYEAYEKKDELRG